MADYKSEFTGAQIDAAIKKANTALQPTGAVMTGPMVLSGDPASDKEAASKAYVDRVAANSTGGTPNAVQYVEQTLTEDQQTIARANIGAASQMEVDALSEEITKKQPVGRYVKTINGNEPDENGNISIAGNGIDASVDTTLSINGAAADAAAVGAALKRKASVIISESDIATSHSDLHDTANIKFIGSQYAFGTAKYMPSENVMPMMNRTQAKNGVTCVSDGRFAILNGTAEANGSFEICDIAMDTKPAGKYYVKVEVHPGESTRASKPLWMFVRYADQSSNTQVYKPYISNGSVSGEFTAANDFNRFRLLLDVAGGDVYNDYRIWFGVYATDNVIDTGLTVDAGETVEYTSAELHALTVIDTMQHDSTVTAPIDTKTYIDEHAGSKHTYISPEMYGAVGDGAANDTNALQMCLDVAVETGLPVRGYGKYRTMSMLKVTGEHLDIYINQLLYNGTTDAAINLCDCRWTNLEVEYIRSTANGLRLSAETSVGCLFNTVRIGQIHAPESGSDGVEIVGAENTSVLYNTLNIKFISSNRNCYSVNTPDTVNVGENNVYDTLCKCHGWAFYNWGCCRLNQLALEADVGNGFYNTFGSFVGFRFTELIDKIMENNGGTFIKLDGEKLTYLSCYFDGRMYYDAIDVSAMKGIVDKDSVDAISHSSAVCVINCPIYYGDNTISNGYILLGTSMILQNNHKICVPAYPSIYAVSNAVHDMRDSAENHYPFPTTFMVDAINSTIYLPDSYCSLGYNDFEVEQANGYKAVVYGMMGEVVFDGTNQPDGVYHFKIMSDIAHKIRNDRCVAIVEYDVWKVTNDSGETVATYQWDDTN